jgi:CheY-like chemotaxis protein
VIAHIFKPGFSTAESLSLHAGRGMGLDVVQANVQRLGARMMLRSTPGQFTEFRIRFSGEAPMRMLIVDDSNMIRTRIARVVQGGALSGISIVGLAHNGVEAVRIAQAARPDVVTMDLTMPEMDGIECIRNLMKHAAQNQHPGGQRPVRQIHRHCRAAPRRPRLCGQTLQRRRTAPGIAGRDGCQAMNTLSEDELKMFVDSVRHYFKTTTAQEPQITSAFLGTGDSLAGYEFNGIVTFSGSYNGQVIVSMPPPLLRELLLLQHETDLSDGNLLDAVGEIANTLGGNARRCWAGA